jgi:hypothetical protein
MYIDIHIDMDVHMTLVFLPRLATYAHLPRVHMSLCPCARSLARLASFADLPNLLMPYLLRTPSQLMPFRSPEYPYEPLYGISHQPLGLWIVDICWIGYVILILSSCKATIFPLGMLDKEWRQVLSASTKLCKALLMPWRHSIGVRFAAFRGVLSHAWHVTSRHLVNLAAWEGFLLATWRDLLSGLLCAYSLIGAKLYTEEDFNKRTTSFLDRESIHAITVLLLWMRRCALTCHTS